jgi:hypothetical protein
MTIRFVGGDRPQVDLAAATEELYHETAQELARVIQMIRDGQFDQARAAAAAMKDLKSLYLMAIEERNRVEKLRKDLAGSVGTGTLDFDAARAEIGRRLARLRHAGEGG